MFSASKNDNGKLLRTAAANNDQDGIAKLWASGNVDIDDPSPTSGYTAVHFAIERGHIDSVVLLIQYGADPFAKNTRGENAEELANKRLNYYQKQPSNENEQMRANLQWIKSFLHQQRLLDVVKLKNELAGCVRLKKYQDIKSILENLHSIDTSGEDVAEWIMDQLLGYIKANEFEVVNRIFSFLVEHTQYALRSNEDTNAKLSEAFRRLKDFAKTKSKEFDLLRQVSDLLTLQSTDNGSSKGFLTTPFEAAARGFMLTVAFFYKQDPQLINKQDEDGCTLVHYAALYGHVDVIRFLAKQKEINLDLMNNNHATPLILCIKNEDIETFKCLVDCGADPHKECGPDRGTAFDHAATYAPLHFVESLVTHYGHYFLGSGTYTAVDAASVRLKKNPSDTVFNYILNQFLLKAHEQKLLSALKANDSVAAIDAFASMSAFSSGQERIKKIFLIYLRLYLTIHTFDTWKKIIAFAVDNRINLDVHTLKLQVCLSPQDILDQLKSNLVTHYPVIPVKEMYQEELRLAQFLQLNDRLDESITNTTVLRKFLIAAAETGDINLIRMLMNYPMIKALDRPRWYTPLMAAIRTGKLTIIRYLAENRPEYLHVPNGKGETPLAYANHYGLTDIAKYLTEHMQKTSRPEEKTTDDGVHKTKRKSKAKKKQDSTIFQPDVDLYDPDSSDDESSEEIKNEGHGNASLLQANRFSPLFMQSAQKVFPAKNKPLIYKTIAVGSDADESTAEISKRRHSVKGIMRNNNRKFSEQPKAHSAVPQTLIKRDPATVITQQEQKVQSCDTQGPPVGYIGPNNYATVYTIPFIEFALELCRMKLGNHRDIDPDYRASVIEKSYAKALEISGAAKLCKEELVQLKSQALADEAKKYDFDYYAKNSLFWDFYEQAERVFPASKTKIKKSDNSLYYQLLTKQAPKTCQTIVPLFEIALVKSIRHFLADPNLPSGILDLAAKGSMPSAIPLDANLDSIMMQACYKGMNEMFQYSRSALLYRADVNDRNTRQIQRSFITLLFGEIQQLFNVQPSKAVTVDTLFGQSAKAKENATVILPKSLLCKQIWQEYQGSTLSNRRLVVGP